MWFTFNTPESVIQNFFLGTRSVGIIADDFYNIMDICLDELPTDWKVLYLGYYALETHQNMVNFGMPSKTLLGIGTGIYPVASTVNSDDVATPSAWRRGGLRLH